jgi:hypothetical protein
VRSGFAFGLIETKRCDFAGLFNGKLEAKLNLALRFKRRLISRPIACGRGRGAGNGWHRRNRIFWGGWRLRQVIRKFHIQKIVHVSEDFVRGFFTEGIKAVNAGDGGDVAQALRRIKKIRRGGIFRVAGVSNDKDIAGAGGKRLRQRNGNPSGIRLSRSVDRQKQAAVSPPQPQVMRAGFAFGLIETKRCDFAGFFNGKFETELDLALRFKRRLNPRPIACGHGRGAGNG